ncbi:MAG TPA: hypothetical protein PLD25_03945 [Chloroflexota bacterium]|nr:hypothetical protein [Chloroflexota bacterium]HUM68939.1 hypothetical protein [Chloroflexota bacterium]
MNQTNAFPEAEKQGRLMRLVTAVFEKLFAAIGAHQMGVSPYEARLFMYYSSCGGEEAMMYQAMVRMKYAQEAP